MNIIPYDELYAKLLNNLATGRRKEIQKKSWETLPQN